MSENDILKTWMYKGWICTGLLYSDGSMHDASVFDSHGFRTEYSKNFSSFTDFVNYVELNDVVF